VTLDDVRVLRDVTIFAGFSLKVGHLQPAQNLVPETNQLHACFCSVKGGNTDSFSASPCSAPRTSLSTHALRLALCRALYLNRS
jgi:hypothetical protein